MNSISSAPKRPEKRGNVQKIVRNEDVFKSGKNAAPFEEITLSDDESPPPKAVKCSFCPKDMTFWSISRREIHMKVCQDRNETKKKEKTKVKKKLTETIEQDDVVEDKICTEPNTSQKWEYSKNNVKFARIAVDDEDNRRRKRPRSYAVVELAPKKCQCEIITTLHSRFMDEFHFKTLRNREEKENGVSEHAYQWRRMLEKVTRYEQLSWDMQKTFDEMASTSNQSIFTLKCSDGELKCPSLILKHRTTMLRKNPRIEVMEVGKTMELVKIWLNFVYSATIEWNEEHREEMKDLAKLYGPPGLESILKCEEVDLTVAAKPSTSEELAPAPKVSEQPEEQPLVEEVSPQASADHVDPIEPIDVFMTDDPYVNFGNVGTVSGMDDDDIILLDDAPPTSTSSTPRKPTRNISMDSFDEWSNSSPNLRVKSKSSPLITITPKSTPLMKPVFGSHVKILKTDGITPMPEFEKMEEAELKERMKEIGMRPKGKKAMIQMLTKAYTTLHPEICSGTPTLRPLIRTVTESPGKQQRVKKPTKSLNERLRSPKKLEKVVEDEELEDDEIADKTLNLSNDEREVGRICGDDVGGDGEEEEASTSSGQSKIEELKSAFLVWLRSDSNMVLYEHILSLQPVSLEEMLIRLEKAEGPLGRIGKGKLVSVLESLRITYQLPQKGGPRKIGGGFKRRL